MTDLIIITEAEYKAILLALSVNKRTAHTVSAIGQEIGELTTHYATCSPLPFWWWRTLFY